MRRFRFPLPSPATTIACLALAVSLSGVGYAAVTLADNTVKSRHIVDKALKGRDIAPGVVPPSAAWTASRAWSLDAFTDLGSTTLASLPAAKYVLQGTVVLSSEMITDHVVMRCEIWTSDGLHAYSVSQTVNPGETEVIPLAGTMPLATGRNINLDCSATAQGTTGEDFEMSGKTTLVAVQVAREARRTLAREG